MGLYLTVLLLLIICIIKYDLGNGSRKNGDIWYYTICVILILIAGFRYRVGGDTLGYFDAYSSWPTFSEFSKVDFTLLPYQPLWYVLAALCKLISPEFYIFQLVQATIVTVISFWFLRKHVRYKFIAVLLWFYIMYFTLTMEVMREAICISLWLLAVDHMIQKQYMRYYIWAVIAFLFHLTAAILLIMPFVYCLIKKGGIWFVVVFLIFTVSFLVISTYPEFFINWLPFRMVHKIIVYSEAGELNLFVKRSCLHIIAIYIGIQVYRKLYPNNLEFIPFLKLEIAVFFASPILFLITERVVNYLYIFEIVILTQSIQIFSTKHYFRFQLSCVKLLLAISFILVLKTYYYMNHPPKVPDTRNYNLIEPYESIFAPRIHPWRERIYYYNEDVVND